MDDAAANGIRSCDPAGPLLIGPLLRLRPRILRLYRHRPEGAHSGPILQARKDLRVKNVRRTVLMMGRATEQIQDVLLGNTVALVGVDQYILKSGTIRTCGGFPQHCRHEVHCVPCREGCREGQGWQRPAQAGRRSEEAVQV